MEQTNGYVTLNYLNAETLDRCRVVANATINAASVLRLMNFNGTSGLGIHAFFANHKSRFYRPNDRCLSCSTENIGMYHYTGIVIYYRKHLSRTFAK